MARSREIYAREYWELFAELDQALESSTPELLFTIADELVRPGAVILDAGCRDARHLIRLLNQHEATGIAVDPVKWHIDRAHDAVADAGLSDRIRIVQGVLERLPLEDESVDFIWCRDVLEVVEDLDGAIAESARVLRVGGAMLVYTNVATSLLADFELEMLRDLGNAPLSMDRDVLEAAFLQHGLSVRTVRVIGTEWRESEEVSDHPVSRDMLRLARLRRQRKTITERYGEATFRTAEASVHWLAFQFLGKLTPLVYILEREGSRSEDQREASVRA